MGTGLAPYIAPTSFIVVAAVALGCTLLLAAEATSLWQVVRRSKAAARWRMRWLAVLSVVAAVWSGGLAIAGYLAYRYFRDSPSYTAAGYDVYRAIQAYEVLTRMGALALGTVGVMGVLIVLGFITLAAPRD